MVLGKPVPGETSLSGAICESSPDSMIFRGRYRYNFGAYRPYYNCFESQASIVVKNVSPDILTFWQSPGGSVEPMRFGCIITDHRRVREQRISTLK